MLSTHKSVLSLICILCFGGWPLSAQIRVTQSGNPNPELQDGSTWDNAWSSAKLAAQFSGTTRGGTGGEYWLATGVYPFMRPHHDVKIYGGFNGTEKKREERDPSTNQTTLMGISFAAYQLVDENNELLEWKHPGDGNLVDGCTLFASEDTLPLSGNYSPGIPLAGPPLIVNCKIVGSAGLSSVVNVGSGPLKLVNCEIRSGQGPGLSVGNSDGYLELIDCNIHHNREAGLIAWTGSTLKMTRCTISNNGHDASSRLPAVSRYSGVFIQEASAEIVDSVINENQGELGGGVTVILMEEETHKVKIANSTISGNTTVSPGRAGGAISSTTFNTQAADRVILTNCVITANTNLSTAGAGGVYMYGSGTRVENSKIIGNQTAASGGGVFAYAYASEPSTRVAYVRNCLIANNSAVNGGGFYLQNSDAQIINCTIADNHATNQGGALYSEGSRSPSGTAPDLQRRSLFGNSALIGNTAAQASLIYHVAAGFDPQTAPAPPRFRNSVYSEGATSLVRTFNGTAPLPAPEGLSPVASAGFVGNGDYHLAPTSPLINAGTNDLLTTFDLDGQPRLLGASIDIGAYEAPATNDPEPLTITRLSTGEIRLTFSGRLQFKPSLDVPSWDDIPGTGQVEIAPTAQQGFWRTVTP
jgi:predicted outer membrane repeat protein